MRILSCFFSVYIGAVAVARCGEIPTVAVIKKKVTWPAQHGTVLQQLIQLASNQNVPMGIVIKNSDLLCKTKASQNYTEVELSKIIDDFLLGSGYEWNLHDGVLEVRPRSEMGQIDARVLQTKLTTFSGINTTIQGLGVILAGYVRAVLFPGEGYAGNIMASLDAETIPPFTLQDVTAEEVADSIVSRGSKGVWMLYQMTRVDEKQVNLRAFGYKDDATILRKTPCIVDTQ
jgi:hypothetical protein